MALHHLLQRGMSRSARSFLWFAFNQSTQFVDGRCMTSPASPEPPGAPTVLPQSTQPAAHRFDRKSVIAVGAAFLVLVVIGGWLAYADHAPAAKANRADSARRPSQAGPSVLVASQFPPTLAGEVRGTDSSAEAISLGLARSLQSHGLTDTIAAVYGPPGPQPALIVAAGRTHASTPNLGNEIRQLAGSAATQSKNKIDGLTVNCFTGTRTPVSVCVWQSASSFLLVEGHDLRTGVTAVLTIKRDLRLS